MVIIQLCRCGQKEVKHVLMENQTMSEKKPTWMCPVCGKPAPYDQLIIDGLLSKILSINQTMEKLNEIMHKRLISISEISQLTKHLIYERGDFLKHGHTKNGDCSDTITS